MVEPHVTANEAEHTVMAHITMVAEQLEALAIARLGRRRGINVFTTALATVVAFRLCDTRGDARANYEQTMEIAWTNAMTAHVAAASEEKKS